MNLDRFMELEKQRREIIAETENLKSQKNAVSKKISEMKKNKENADAVILEMRQVGEKISQLNKQSFVKFKMNYMIFYFVFQICAMNLYQ